MLPSSRAIALVCLAAVIPASAASPSVWRSSTFAERVDGVLADGGANTYVAADGSIRLIHTNDLNHDGHLDLVAPTDHSQSDGRVDLSIFWGRSRHATGDVTRLPSDRGRATAAADLNGDGYVDLVLANSGSDPWRPIASGQSSYIFWGARDGFSPARRTELPTQNAYGVALGDLDGDGAIDIVFANIGNFISADHHQKSYIYWGDRGAYDLTRRTELSTEKATDVELVDVTGDGRPDAVFSQEGNLPGGGGVVIFASAGADRKGWSLRRAHLASDSASDVAVADLNGDGHPDIVVACEYRSKGREADLIYTIDNEVQLDSWIYWGSRDGYANARRTALPTLKATGVSIGDLNSDGRPDIVFSNGSGGIGYGSANTGAQPAGGQGYVYWNGPEGFSAHRRLALPSSYAAGCAVADVNHDGHPDVVFANQSDGRSYDVNSYIYWGGPSGPDPKRRAELPTYGASGALVADLDGDRAPEIVFSNSLSNTVEGNRNSQRIYWGDGTGAFDPSRALLLPLGSGYVGAGSYSIVDVNADGYCDLTFTGLSPTTYWGGARGLDPSNHSIISSRYSFHSTFADFNRDGYLDFVCSEFYPGSTESRVYFGSPTGYAPLSRFAFLLNGPRAMSVADLNRDGWLDVIFATATDSGMLAIFWGSAHGFDNARRTELPVGMAPAGRIADLNNDGWLDIAVANLFQPKQRPREGLPQHAFGGSTEGNAFVYWGGPHGFAPEKRQILPGIGLEDLSIADFNKDGLLDVAASHYSGSVDRKHPSYVYWNSQSGFTAENVTLLTTYAASGVMAADFNNDGFWDIRFANHVKDSNHNVSNFIYWGSAKGFSPERRSEVYNPGPHLLTGRDIGNVYDRGDRYDYVSTPFDAGAPRSFESLEWMAETPFRTRVEFQARSAASAEEIARAPWIGPNGPRSHYVKPGPLAGMSGRWIQYKATLVSPGDVNTPILRDVVIGYR